MSQYYDKEQVDKKLSQNLVRVEEVGEEVKEDVTKKVLSDVQVFTSQTTNKVNTLEGKVSQLDNKTTELNSNINILDTKVDNLSDSVTLSVSPISIKLTDTSDYLATLDDGAYRVESAGTYTNMGGLVVKEGYFTIVSKIGTTYKIASEVKMPMQDLTPLNDKVYNIENELTNQIRNYIDSSLFEAGYILSSGSYGNSNNWIRIPYGKIPEELKGKEVTLKGIGSVPADNLVVSIRNSDNESIFNIVGNGSATPSIHQFEVPLNADRWAFSITNDATDGGIGTRPQTNQFVNSLMLTLGNDIHDFIPFGKPVLYIKENKISDSDKITFNNNIEEGNNGAVPSWKIKKFQDKILDLTIESPNLINYLTDFESGRWTTTGAPQETLNSLRTKKLNIPQKIIDIISSEDYQDDLSIVVNGGGKVPTVGAVLVLFDSNNTVIRIINANNTDNQLNYLVFNLPKNARKWAFTIVNDATDGGIGTRVYDNEYVDRFQVEIGTIPTEFKQYGELYINSDKLANTNTEINFNTNEVIVKRINNKTLHIFYHIGGASNKWFRIIYFKQTTLDRFIDVWRLNEGYVCTRLSDTEFSDEHQVINTGVYENAIYTTNSGYTNALGSAHGWEMVEEVTMFLDGRKLDIETNFGTIKGTEFFATTKTYFKSPDGVSNVAQSNKQWRIRDGILNIKNNIKWFSKIGINSNSYISMCSVLRRNSQGTQVTHTGTSNENLELFDITEPGFQTSIYTDQNNPNRTSLIAWGDFFKAQMTVKERNLIRDGVKSVRSDAGMQIQNVVSPNYNKLYGKFGSMTTQNGDIWNIETEYIFNNI